MNECLVTFGVGLSLGKKNQVLSLERRWEKAFVDPSVFVTWGFEVW